jgi:hypothetical protein
MWLIVLERVSNYTKNFINDWKLFAAYFPWLEMKNEIVSENHLLIVKAFFINLVTALFQIDTIMKNFRSRPLKPNKNYNLNCLVYFT